MQRLSKHKPSLKQLNMHGFQLLMVQQVDLQVGHGIHTLLPKDDWRKLLYFQTYPI